MRKEFSENLKTAMDIHKMSIVELAGRIGTTRQAISQYRNGTVMPNVENLCKIADCFSLSADMMLGRAYDSDEVLKELRFIKNKLKAENKALREKLLLLRAMLENCLTQSLMR